MYTNGKKTEFLSDQSSRFSKNSQKSTGFSKSKPKNPLFKHFTYRADLFSQERV